MYVMSNEYSKSAKRSLCDLHKWKRIPVNPSDPDGHVKLVCDECGYIFGSDSEYEENE